MFNPFGLPARVAIPAVLALGVGACGAVAAPSSSAPLRCEIETHLTNGMTVLEGVVYANNPATGSYEFRVAGGGWSGNSDIEQGGAFEVGTQGKATLGRVTIGSGTFEASLDVTVDGVTASCNRHLGGPI